MNFTRNPYFNDDPQFFYWSLRILILVNTILSGISFYTVMYRSPPFLSRTFVKLLVYHGATANLALITVGYLSVPIFYLPYLCIKYVGPFSDLGLSPIVQVGIMSTLILITLSAVVPLFYYRMDAILPRDHILNSKLLRYSVYSCIYVAAPVFPAPAFYFVLSYEDQNELKRILLQSTGVYYEDFMSPQVSVLHLGGSNPLTYMLGFIVLYCCIIGVIAVITASHIILKLTSKVGIVGSVKYKAQQRQLFLSLMAMTAVFLPVLGIIVPGMGILVLLKSYRTNIMNALIFCGMLAIPLAFSAYVITYKPYRQFLLGIFIKKSISPVRRSTDIAVTRASMKNSK